MDFKQEITHLIGIFLTVLENRFFYKDKEVEFYNVYYDFKDKGNDAIEWFFKRANKLGKELLVDKGLCKSFTYEHLTAQEMVKTNKIGDYSRNPNAFGLKDVKVKDKLLEYFDFLI